MKKIEKLPELRILKKMQAWNLVCNFLKFIKTQFSQKVHFSSHIPNFYFFYGLDFSSSI